MRGALIRYGRHTSLCAIRNYLKKATPCTCGFDTALAPNSQPPTDDIVAQHRNGLIGALTMARAHAQFDDDTIAIDRAIAALKGAKYKQRPIVAENSLPSPPLGAS
jgi:hypothetical protein